MWKYHSWENYGNAVPQNPINRVNEFTLFQYEANVGKRHLKNEKLGSTDPKSDEANECLLV